MRRGIGLWAAALAVYAFLYLPLTIVVVYSFNDSRLNAELVGFTWHWYQVLLNDKEMLLAAGNSLFIALVSSLTATLLGTMAGIAMHRYQLKLLTFMVLTPVAMPEILLGVSLLLFFIQVLNLTLGLLSIVLAHITFSIGFVAVIVRARLAGMDESLFEAAAWAPRVVVLTEVTLQVFVADPTGVVRSSTRPEIVGNDISGRDYFRHEADLPADDGHMFVGSLTQGLTTQESPPEK